MQTSKSKIFQQKKYDKLKKNFEDLAKLIKNYEKRPIPNTENYVENKITEFTNALNELKQYITICYGEFSDKEKSDFAGKLAFYEKRYLARLTVFDYTADLPDLFTEIDKSALRQITRANALDISKRYNESEGLEAILEEEEIDTNETENDESTESIESEIELEVNENLDFEFREFPDIIDLFTESNLTIRYNQRKKSEMAFEFTANVSRIIKNNFDGNIEELDSFIAAVELANEATPPNQQNLLVKYIRTKLKGEAFSYVPADTPNGTRVIELLQQRATGDSSKVILGRLLALRSDRNSMQKFQEQAEELTDKLKRAYISDGMSESLANQTTIDKTVEMCRLSAKSQLVRSVLASTKFDKPKEVLAKLITEANIENTEVKILAFGGNRTQYRGRVKFSNNRGNFNYNNNRNGGYNGNYGRYNQNGYNNQNYGQRGRGRGRGRGNFNNYRQHHGNYNNNRNDRNVRVVQENQPAPSGERGNQGQNVAIREM